MVGLARHVLLLTSLPVVGQAGGVIPRRPRTISTIDGLFDLNQYDVQAVLPDGAQVRVASPADLEALVAQMTEVPLLINPRTVAPGVVPGATAPVFTFAGEPPTDEG